MSDGVEETLNDDTPGRGAGTGGPALDEEARAAAPAGAGDEEVAAGKGGGAEPPPLPEGDAASSGSFIREEEARDRTADTASVSEDGTSSSQERRAEEEGGHGDVAAAGDADAGESAPGQDQDDRPGADAAAPDDVAEACGGGSIFIGDRREEAASVSEDGRGDSSSQERGAEEGQDHGEEAGASAGSDVGAPLPDDQAGPAGAAAPEPDASPQVLADQPQQHLVPSDPLSAALDTLFRNVSRFVQAELELAHNEYRLLERMNLRAAHEYEEHGDFAAGLRVFVEQVREKHERYTEYLGQIDEIEAEVTRLEALVSSLDTCTATLYSKVMAVYGDHSRSPLPPPH